MSAHPQQPKGPDFAFPQTVAKNAEAALRHAERSGDAPAAIEALLQIMVADHLIDGQTTQKTITAIEGATAKFADAPLASLFYALQAQAYQQFLDENWQLSRRTVPVDALSADITEWSGDQVRQRITELVGKSLDASQPLADKALADYQNIITSDSVSRVYYPTLLDFVYCHALDMYRDIDGTEARRQAVIDMALAHSAPMSAPAIIWTSRSVADKPDADVLQAYRDNVASPFAGLLLETCYQRGINPEGTKDNKWLYAQVDSLLASDPDATVRPTLLSIKQDLSQKHASVRFPTLCGIGQTITVKVDYANTNVLTVNVYSVSASSQGKNMLKGLKPVRSIPVGVEGTVPFSGTTTVDITLDQPGYYVVVAEGDGLKDESYGYHKTRVIGAYPIAFSRCSRALVAVVDPVTGAPLPGAKVEVVRDKRSIYTATADSQGIADVTPGCRAYSWQYVAVSYGGQRYVFDNVSIGISDDDNDNNSSNLSVSTDRSLYHLGETVNFLIVVSQATSTPTGQWSAKLASSKALKVKLLDANMQQIGEAEGVTDDFGRFAGSFELPADGLTGRFQVIAMYADDRYGRTSASVTVSDYKLPDFELLKPVVARDVPTPGSVTISGTAMTYSGVPLQGVTVTATVNTASWWRWFTPQRQVFSAETTTDADGRYQVVVPDSVFAQSPDDKFYMATLDGVSPSGTAAQATVPFSLGKQYMISIDEPQANIDGERPFAPSVTVTAPDGEAVDIPLMWTLSQGDTLVDMGTLDGPIALGGVTPGEYTFTVKAVDSALADDARVNITLYNRSTGIVPGDKPLWVETTRLDIDGRRVSIPYGTTGTDTYIYYTLSDFANLRHCGVVRVGQGYHDLEVALPADYQWGSVTLYVVNDAELTMRTVTLTRPSRRSLVIEGETWRDKLVPGQAETWRLRITQADGQPVQSALVLDMYNKALEALAPHHLAVNLPRQWMSTQLSADVPYCGNGYNSSALQIGTVVTPPITSPIFNDYGRPWMARRGGMVMYSKSVRDMGVNMVEESAMCDMAPMPMAVNTSMNGDAAFDDAEAKEEKEVGGEQPQPAAETFDYRDSEVPLAIWAPLLTTDSLGNVTYEFTVPNANTTWRLRAVAWARDLNVGTLMRDFVAQKPIMVQPNAPRFMRVGDTSAITCLIINNSDTAVTATTTVELFDPLTDKVYETHLFTTPLAAGAQATVEAPFNATDGLTAIGYRVRTSNGRFADGERAVMRVLPSSTELIETRPFYLNPGDTTLTMTLPADQGARLSLTFTENPAWTIVSALPGMRQMRDNCANSAAAALFSASIARGILHDNPAMARVIKMWQDNPADSALVSMLEKNEDLKLAVLNATPWVQAAQSDTERMANLALIFDNGQTDAAIAAAVKTLGKLQRADGGWAWGNWCRESSVWVTANVLEMLGDLKVYGWLPADATLNTMIAKAVRYYDAHVYDKRYPDQPDMLYCLLRPRFSDIPVSADGKKVIAATLKHINKGWRKMDDPAVKASAAMVLYLNGEARQAGTLMASLSEFGVWTPSQGLTYPSVNSLASYGVILEAYAMILPGSRQVDGLRQQLIVRKEATDWGSAVVTSQVVASILSSGSRWTVDAQGATVTAGTTRIVPSSPIETATGAMRADLSAYAGQQLTIATTGVGPAYGAVFAQFERQIDAVEAAACDDLSITKQMWVRRGGEWAVIDTLAVGDRVRVQLTIHAKRNMQYVTVHDDRPAAFEPVDQLPGWMWADGAGFYRENRDTFTGLYIEYLRPGTYLLTYDMNVAHPGTYLSGVASIQSQYAPSLAAHSAGQLLQVKNEK